MKTNNKKLSDWLLWEPLKFSCLCFGLIFLAATIHTFLLEGLLPPDISQNTFIFLTSVAFIYSLIFLIKKLPVKKMDRSSFVSLHIAQTLITTICFYFITYLVIYNSQSIMFQLMLMETKSFGLFFIAMLLFGLGLLYLSGIFFSNLYAKIRRIQEFDIPTWKIIFSIPFGFSALWIPGFLMEESDKAQSVSTDNKTYNKLINWTLSNNTNTVSVFIFITLLSILLFGLSAVLLTFIFALIYGIWNLQIGTKKFKQKISKNYSTVAVIINIIMVLVTIGLGALMPQKTETITINITDTNTTTQTIQGQ